MKTIYNENFNLFSVSDYKICLSKLFPRCFVRDKYRYHFSNTDRFYLKKEGEGRRWGGISSASIKQTKKC